MTDQLPLPGPQRGDCPCGCGLYGVIRQKVMRDGLAHVKGCACVRCRGARNRRAGLSKQREARKRLGVAPQKFGDANEERWADHLFANEVKAGKQVGPLLNWWIRVEAQVLSNAPDHGGLRKPTRAVAMPEGWGKDGLVVVKLSTWDELIRPALDDAYGAAQ